MSFLPPCHVASGIRRRNAACISGQLVIADPRDELRFGLIRPADGYGLAVVSELDVDFLLELAIDENPAIATNYRHSLIDSRWLTMAVLDCFAD